MVCGTASCALATAPITTFEAPGAGNNGATGQGTLAFAINPAGAIMGFTMTPTAPTASCAIATAHSLCSMFRARARQRHPRVRYQPGGGDHGILL